MHEVVHKKSWILRQWMNLFYPNCVNSSMKHYWNEIQREIRLWAILACDLLHAGKSNFVKLRQNCLLATAFTHYVHHCRQTFQVVIVGNTSNRTNVKRILHYMHSLLQNSPFLINHLVAIHIVGLLSVWKAETPRITFFFLILSHVEKFNGPPLPK